MKLLRKSLLLKLVGTFSILSIVTVGLVAFTAYGRAKDALQASIFDRLEVAASLKEYELNQWFTSQRRDAMLLAQSPEVITRINGLASDPGTVDISQDAQFLSDYFEIFLNIKSDVQEISILTNGGIVLLSTDQSQEGTYQGLGNNTTYFEPGQETNVVPNIYISSLTGEPTITFATPIDDNTGQRIAVLALTLDLQAIDSFIRDRTGLGETGETYLVKQLSGRNQFIASDNAEAGQFIQGMSSQGINTAIQGRAGADLYINYDNVPVIGVYRWLSGSNLALLAEISQQEAFRPAVRLAHGILLIGLGTVGLMLVMIYLLARQIAKPVLDLTDVAVAIEAGEYEATHSPAIEIVKRRFDELGRLASVFQTMAEQVYAREQKLKRQVAELRIEIDQAKKTRQVAEITETDYFRELRRKAKELRKPKGSA
ncbi:MAG: cache domain-containing protein [Cyanobacteria bacterium J06635_15]